jgi:hypothetical protein
MGHPGPCPAALRGAGARGEGGGGACPHAGDVWRAAMPPAVVCTHLAVCPVCGPQRARRGFLVSTGPRPCHDLPGAGGGRGLGGGGVGGVDGGGGDDTLVSGHTYGRPTTGSLGSHCHTLLLSVSLSANRRASVQLVYPVRALCIEYASALPLGDCAGAAWPCLGCALALPWPKQLPAPPPGGGKQCRPWLPGSRWARLPARRDRQPVLRVHRSKAVAANMWVGLGDPRCLVPRHQGAAWQRELWASQQILLMMCGGQSSML